MNAKTEKIKKMSRILWGFSNTGGVLLIVAMVSFIVFFIIEPNMSSITFSGAVSMLPVDGTSEIFRMLMATQVLYTGFMSAILFITGLIFKDISRECTPFSINHVKKLKLISKLIIALNILIPIVRVVYYLLFALNTNQNVTITDVNVGNIVFAAILYCLALIFEYGVELQQQADETL